MGVTKAYIFTDHQNYLASMAKALAHPARVAILEHLIEYKTCMNNELIRKLGLAQATISQHLMELKKVGLVRGTNSGTSMNYYIDANVWEKVKKDFSVFFGTQVDQNCS